jgi:hypothetical protein
LYNLQQFPDIGPSLYYSLVFLYSISLSHNMGIDKASRTKSSSWNGMKMQYRAAIVSILGLMLLAGTAGGLPAYAATGTLSVSGVALDGKPLSMWITVQSNGSTLKTGFTPLMFSGNTENLYSVTAHDYSGGQIFFDHWEDGSTSRTRTVALSESVVITAYYRTPDSKSHTLTVNAYDQSGTARSMYTTIREGSTTVKTGFAPLSHEGIAGNTYSVSVSDYGNLFFDHWENGSTSRMRTITLNTDISISAYYIDTTISSTPLASANTAPVATNDSATTKQDTAVDIDVLANDSDTDGDVLTVASVTDPANGTTANKGSGIVTYTPDPGFSGTDSFNYTLSDGNGNSAMGTVVVTVEPAEAPPLLPSNYELLVDAVDPSGNPRTGMYTTIREGSTTVKTGFTPVPFTGNAGTAYSVTVSDYGSSIFDHWEDGSTSRTRIVALNSDVTVTAHYRTPVLTLSPTSGDGGSTVITATGHYFSPSTLVSITYDGKAAASAATNSTGVFTTSFTAPSAGTGFHTILATDARGWKASAEFEDTAVTAPHEADDLIPKTGVIVALYMYPGSTGSVHWQKVIDEKNKHPSVPIVVIFNPSSGPGSAKDNNIASWVAKLQGAGIIAVGYTPDGYADTKNPGTRTMTYMKDAISKYKNWYNADGVYFDEFTNKLGYEDRYRELDAYAKSLGMKITAGNPGTDVPPSYIGTIDVIKTSEGKGYISPTDPNIIGSSWVSGGYSGWHKDHDKRNFAIVRYDVTSLDRNFVTEVSKYMGLMYITDGNDSNSRWFHVPPYFGDLVATLDQ